MRYIETSRLRITPADPHANFSDVWLLNDRHLARCIGWMSARVPRHAEIGDGAELRYAVDPPYRGRGFVSEAAPALVSYLFTGPDAPPGLNKIYASTAVLNTPSRRVLEGLGMREVSFDVPDWESLRDDVEPKEALTDLSQFARIEYELHRVEWLGQAREQRNRHVFAG